MKKAMNAHEDILLYIDGIPDDDALLEELTALIDDALWPESELPDFLPPLPISLPNQRSRILKLLGNALYFLVLLIITLAAVSRNMGGNGARNLMGFSMFNVLSESMQSAIPKGSLVLTKQTDPNAIQIGDDITFMVSENISITHRVVGIIENHQNSGTRGFETKGVDNERSDSDIVLASNVAGRVIFHMPYVGTAMVAVSEHWLVLLLPFTGILIFASIYKYAFSNKAKEKSRSGLSKAFPALSK